MHVIPVLQKKSKDRNVNYRGYITTYERGVGWVGLEGGGGEG